MKFKPIIKLSNKPDVVSFNIKFNPSKLEEITSNKNLSSNELIELDAQLSLKFKMNIFNDGYQKASLILNFIADTLTDVDFMRDVILTKRIDKIEYKNIPAPNYMINELQPGDATELSFNHNIQFFRDRKFTIHYILFYENELGILYDTYFWFVFKMNTLHIQEDFKKVNSDIYHRYAVTDKSANEVFSCEVNRSSYKKYSNTEKETVREFINKIKE